MKPHKPKPYKPQTLEPSIQESLRRVSRWAHTSLTKQGATARAESDREQERR